jgi:hypothetical protein
MARMVLVALIWVGMGLGSTASAVRPPEKAISFQGRLTSADGAPITPTALMTFSVYDSSAAGNLVWTSGEHTVPCDAGGRYEVILGSTLPGYCCGPAMTSVSFAITLWLEIKVGSDPPMTPRIPLTSAPYSVHALDVKDGIVTSAKLADGAAVRSLNTLTDDVTLVGGAGISVTPSGNTLTIAGSGSGSDAWTVSGSDVHTTVTGNVGIGTSAPSSKLTVLGGVEVRRPGTAGGDIRVLGPGSAEAVRLEGYDAAGGGGSRLTLYDQDADKTVDLDASVLGGGSQLILHNENGVQTIDLQGSGAGASGLVRLYTPFGVPTLDLEGQEGGSSTQGSQLILRNEQGLTTTELDGDIGNSGGLIFKAPASSKTTVNIEGQEAGNGSDGASIKLFDLTGASETVDLDANETGGGSVVNLRSGTNVRTVRLDGEDGGTGGLILLYDNALAQPKIELDADDNDGGAMLYLKNDAGTSTVVIDAQDSGGSGRISTGVLQITGGSDLSEQFDIRAPEGEPKPGYVVSIDPESPADLCLARHAYDRRVAGVISGAGGVRPGMLMEQAGSEAAGAHPVALTGRVYCWTDASYGAVEPGDLLTTSDTPGHAMKVRDHSRAQGAILGKAMTSLQEGTGLVLVLVTLQ